MKYLFLFVFLLISGKLSFAQDSIAANPDAGLKERIVQLALQNNKGLEVADHKVNIAEYELKQSKRWWLDEISLSFNANEFTVKRLQNKQDNNGVDARYSYYPLYNFGVNIPIGRVFTKSMSVKTAREQVEISKVMQDDQRQLLKAQALSAYQDFVQNKKLYALQLKTTEDIFNEFLQAKEQFKNDQISLDDYNQASSRYDAAIRSKVTAEHDYQLSKITFEHLIGISVEQLLSSNQ